MYIYRFYIYIHIIKEKNIISISQLLEVLTVTSPSWVWSVCRTCERFFVASGTTSVGNRLKQCWNIDVQPMLEYQILPTFNVGIEVHCCNTLAIQLQYSCNCSTNVNLELQLYHIFNSNWRINPMYVPFRQVVVTVALRNGQCCYALKSVQGDGSNVLWTKKDKKSDIALMADDIGAWSTLVKTRGNIVLSRFIINE